ncbi:hypothetical protein O0L34_g16071 [Tuta absoluta]|nr:hypothetical protein O0L34_g16071 [Tuta absoluta]
MSDNTRMASPSRGPVYETLHPQKYPFSQFPTAQVQPQVMHDKKSTENRHTAEHNYCAHCRLSFLSKFEFEHHNVEMHQLQEQKKLLTCTECTATFRRQDHLKRHMQSLHQNQKYCICPVCKKDCKRQDILLKHIKRKHTTTAEIFHCRECEFQCNSHTELEKHELSHLLIERHVCSYCNATFKRRDHMLRHVKSQHLNQSIICPICNQSYKRKDHVVRHVREKHKMGYLNGKLVTSQDML